MIADRYLCSIRPEASLLAVPRSEREKTQGVIGTDFIYIYYIKNLKQLGPCKLDDPMKIMLILAKVWVKNKEVVYLVNITFFTFEYYILTSLCWCVLTDKFFYYVYILLIHDVINPPMQSITHVTTWLSEYFIFCSIS